MAKFIYTVHANSKLKSPLAIKLRITRKKIQNVIENPAELDKSEEPVYIAIGELSDKLSLCVAYRRVEAGIRIITFYPAERGRYESKILQRG